MSHRPTGVRIALATAALLVGSAAPAAAQRARGPQPTAVRNVRLSPEEDAPRHTILLRNGRIESVIEVDAELPAGYLRIEGQGRVAVPAFLDVYSHAGCETPTPEPTADRPADTRSDLRIDMREANRKGVQPSFAAADVYALEDKETTKWREQGFGALATSPHGQILAGDSALVTTRDAARRDVVLLPRLFACAAFQASGSGYPSTLMGFHAQLRQFVEDARRHRLLRERFEAGRPGPRPPYDTELEAGGRLIDGTTLVLCSAETARDVDRWLGLADELGLRVGFAGGREAWKRAAVLAEREVPVVLTLDWGEEVKDPNEAKGEKGKKGKQRQGEQAGEPEPEQTGEPEAGEAAPDEAEAEAEPETDWIYEEPRAVREERRRLWVANRDGAQRLVEAGVEIAFGTGGGSAKDLLEHVRTLVAEGLPRDAALRALTSGAAELCGVSARLGAIEAGRDATFSLWTGDPLEKGSQAVWTFVDGMPHEFEVEDDLGEREPPDDGVDATGTWSMVFDDGNAPNESTAVLEMTEEGKVSGTITRQMPGGGGEMTTDVEGWVSGAEITLKGSFSLGEVEVSLSIEGELDGDAVTGTATVSGPWGSSELSIEGRRTPEGAIR